jgi:hypothetical protein
VQHTGRTGIHGAVYTTLKKDGKKQNLDPTTDNSRELEEEEIKQGTGKLRACGPSTFLSVDSFIKYGESVLITAPACAAVNTVNTVDQNKTEIKGNVKCNENVHEKVNEIKSIQID